MVFVNYSNHFSSSNVRFTLIGIQSIPMCVDEESNPT